ncbi:MAG: ribonuclease J [Thermoanaerobaculaceae bacterium]|nr:ribonuclease J [Thermoanaerobaculaceae bacterium]
MAGSRATLARLQLAVDESPLEWQRLAGGGALPLAGFQLEVASVSHSIPGTLAARLQGEGGTVVVASDFRLAPSALAEATEVETLARWGEEGVDLLLLDATNALLPGPLPEEATVASTIEGLVAAARGAVVGVTFASHVGRFRQLARAAVACGRTVVPVGRGLEEALSLQAGLGGLDLPPGSIRSFRSLPRLPREQLLLVVTGSQGEAGSVFPRVATDTLPGFRLTAGDLVLHCARVIPGSERRVADLFDHCVRRGARVVTQAEAPVHVSGHPPQEELRRTIELLRPRTVVPIHGRRRNLEGLAELARSLGCRTAVVENGAELVCRRGEVAPSGVLRGVGRVLVGEAEGAVLDSVTVRQRRTLARTGLIVASLALARREGRVVGDPQLQCLGVELPAGVRTGLLRDLAAEASRLAQERARDGESVRSTISRWLRSELRRRTGRRPSTVVLVSEC